MSRSVFITGSTGFIGRHLCRRAGQGRRQWQREDGNLCSLEDVKRWLPLTTPVSLIHLASRGVRHTESDNAELNSVNVEMTRNLVGSLAPGSRLVLAGSMAQYGTGGILSEDMACRPKTAYARSKADAEELAFSVAQERGLEVVSARLFGVYGPGEPEGRLFPSLISALRRGQPFSLSDGTQSRDFVHVADACEALLRLASAPLESPTLAVNVGSGVGVTVREIAELVAEALGQDRKLLIFGAAPRSPGDQDQLIADTRRLRALLAWAPPQRLLRLEEVKSLVNSWDV